MLQADEPTDFVLVTGTRPTPSATSPGFRFDPVNINGEDYVRFDESYLRPTEVDALVGDASKAEKILGGSRRCCRRSWRGSWSTPS